MNAPFSHPLPVTLSTLALASRWVAWQTQEREPGKPRTKVPYDPSSQGKALADNHATWSTRPSAEARAARLPKPFGARGVGIELGNLGDGRCLGGVDLDTCRDEDGTLAPWAMEVVDRLNSYTEISPSRSGVKVFFTYALADLPAIREVMGTHHGKMWKRLGNGEHPPAIELHIGNRYFAVTDEQLAGTPNELRPIALDTLLWLILEAGPAFVGTDRTQAKHDGPHDNSRSAVAFRKGADMRRAGTTFEEMCAALRADPDTAEWVREKGDAAGGRQLHRLWERASEGEAARHAEDKREPPDRKRPLFRPLPPAPAFPMHALGPLRAAAEAIQLRTQAPAAICGQSVLAAATLAVQSHRDVELPGAGRRPLTGVFASVAESGERKTSVDRIALAPVYKIEEKWRQDREGEVTAFASDHDAWKAAREVAKKKHKGDRAAIRDALNAIGGEPKPPPEAMLLVEDFSPEALVLHLRDSRPWAGVFTSEGGVLVGGHAFNDEKAMQTGALFNTLWDGAPIRRSRVLTGTAFLPGRRCSAHVMMQRVVADKLLGDAVLDGIGMTARMLIVEPESTIGIRPFREAPAACSEVLRAYSDRIIELLNRQPTTAPDSPCVLDPPAMTLPAETRALWVDFHDAVERDLAPGGALHSIRAFGAKMAEHAGRLAAVLTVYADAGTMEVGAEALACGIMLAQHYAAEMLRLQGGATVSPDLRLAARLVTWWETRPDPRCHLAAIYQTGPGALRDSATARRIIGILVEHGWLVRLPIGTEIDGSRRRDAWELVP